MLRDERRYKTLIMQAQDPGELFDIVTRDGEPLGLRKPRALVHRDGDWHRSVHIWVALRHGTGIPDAKKGPWLVFQCRSAQKDTWPNAIDIAVTGHLGAGETPEGALREAREEIGITLTPDEVIRLGLRRRVDDHRHGILDRELQEIFFTILDQPLTALTPAPAEVSALVALPLDDAGALFRGERAEALGARLDPEGHVEAAFPIRFADFIPASDGYYERACRSIDGHLAGEEQKAWEIG